ncbi:MAG: response regulator transcription factor [Candidatus Didemnitutus sp.]|nr:response regulator transcription factor [Candidatus Didemnitutus sp.]
MKLKVLIADDEPLALDKLRRLLATENDLEIAGAATNGADALRLARELQPDILVLDIQMPPLDGLEVAHTLDEGARAVIFTTAFPQHAVDAFAANAVDYLLKPYSKEQFARALGRARSRLAATADATRTGRSDRLLVKSRDRYVVVHVNDIEWIEAAANYVVLHSSSGNHVLRGTMTDTLAEVGEDLFFRTGRSAAVNLDRVNEVLFDEPGEHVLLLRSGARVRLQRNFRELQERLEKRTAAHARREGTAA